MTSGAMYDAYGIKHTIESDSLTDYEPDLIATIANIDARLARIENVVDTFIAYAKPYVEQVVPFVERFASSPMGRMLIGKQK